MTSNEYLHLLGKNVVIISDNIRIEAFVAAIDSKVGITFMCNKKFEPVLCLTLGEEDIEEVFNQFVQQIEDGVIDTDAVTYKNTRVDRNVKTIICPFEKMSREEAEERDRKLTNGVLI